MNAQAKRVFVSSGQDAAWVVFENGALELEQQFQLSTAIEHVDVRARGAAVSLGSGGTQWLAAPQ